MDAREIARRAAEPAIATDAENRILALNGAARELLGYDMARAADENLHQLLEARDVFGNRLGSEPGAFYAMVRRGEAVSSFDLEVRTASGDPLRLSVGVIVVLERDSDEHSFVYQFRPILRRRKADEAIERILSEGALDAPDPVSLRGQPSGFEASGLTRRQLEVLRLIVDGASVEEMAKTLGISGNTVRTHIRRILKRFGVRSRVEAASRAFRDGLV